MKPAHAQCPYCPHALPHGTLGSGVDISLALVHAWIHTYTHIHTHTHTLLHTYSLTHSQNAVFDSYNYLDEAHRGFEKPSSLSADAAPAPSRAAPSSSSSYLEELTAMKPLDVGGE